MKANLPKGIAMTTLEIVQKALNLSIYLFTALALIEAGVALYMVKRGNRDPRETLANLGIMVV